ncbi:hypothetical protein TEA_022704 [Camellia sinensis var. sinensis]|uniref:Uncharacterized protein n=1 Tax=Camellia sinensis var. sinensis TaxID=542762 RepID=A0A4S4F0F1_CAMSN|nr:hypothetical protein TEA_022704 [Camellia sinensis var. sinensis]
MHFRLYVCWQCNFFLHDHCGNANRFIKYPSHPLHPLILLPSPTYCSGTLLCNACGPQASPSPTLARCVRLISMSTVLSHLQRASNEVIVVLSSGPFQSGCEDQLEIQLSEEAVVELFKIQLQMQMAEQLAEMLASPNHSSPT